MYYNQESVVHCQDEDQCVRHSGAHGQQTLRGPSPYFITLFLWPLPHIHPYSDFAHVYLYYMILDMALFNQYTSHGVFWKFRSLSWRDARVGALDDAMVNRTPWLWDGKLEVTMGPLENAMMNWDPLIMWWKIRGHHFDDMMRKLEALDGMMEKLRPFALWKKKLQTLNKATLGKLLGAKITWWGKREMGPWWRNGTLIWGVLWWHNRQIRDPSDDEIGGPPDDMMGKLGALDH